MIYRTCTDPTAEETRRDLDTMARDATRRRRHAILVTTSLAACALGVLVTAGIRAVSPHAAVVCHDVEIRYENAPEIPGSRWTACANKQVRTFPVVSRGAR